MQRISVRNARFQQWLTLLDNRGARNRTGEFLVQGVRPITMAVRCRWPLRAVIYHAGANLSRWAREILDGTDALTVAMDGDLIHELGGKDDAPPELVGVAAVPDDDLRRIPAELVVVLDRPASPGNIGTVLRSADAFGATGVIVTGHAADVYDPRTVRASTGSLFAVPAVRVATHREVLAWAGSALRVVGTDETGDVDLAAHDLTPPTLLVVGNESTGLSTAWREACHRTVHIPIGGTASSLNAATAASIALYEAARQRRAL